ncbi:sialidase family protein [uncultured Cyclobacterium sp.]|uniref:sialidase family protein n=1 Tax=uncultured Cyclobacterium sp. TaxID=453820 RepID=UPI0030EF71C2|tara:strand:- start:121383 stop:122933 length:1551 start_codon:yes stop_codon:yes gene_type:complete
MNAKTISKLKILLVCTLLINFISCGGEKDYPVSESITYEQIYVPVIQGSTTTIARLQLESKKEDVLNSLEVAINADSDITDLSIAIVHEDGEEETLQGEFIKGENRWKLLEEKSLLRGNIELTIKVTIPDNTPLNSRFSLNVPMIEVSGSKVIPGGQQNSLAYRIGKALRDEGDDGVAAFRIPGLATSNSGTVLAVYDVRYDDSSDLQGDIDVGLSRSVDGGNTWEPMQIIMDMNEWGGLPQDQNGIGDPSILVDEASGDIYVVALWLHGKPGTAAWRSSEPGLKPEETGQLMIVKSEDDGLTWTEPINITQPMKDASWQLFFNGPGKGISMKDGTLVFAAQYKDHEQIPHSTIIYSQDQGETWQVGAGARSKTTEAQVVELLNGELMLNMRDDRGGSRAVLTTPDMGKTWQEHPSNRSALIEPICMASLIRYNQDWLLFSNPAATEGRYNITVKASKDEGLTWPEAHQVLLDDQKGWGYSCMTMIDEENLGIIYESSQAHMTFQILPISEIVSQE